uniref:STAS domain-containing protein n=1 Tax=Globisporangium ultimum (strain ATCC 200006 / CBS 805.95 / DAOM BR144) TaxID=431595 RepID=K3X6Y2_GLOUD
MESVGEQWSKFWYKRMPILNWLPQYNLRRDLKFDLIAGCTVGVMLVPQEMSLAAMMGVPAQYGLYSAAIAPLIYPMFGSSKALSVANAAEGSLLVGVMLRSADLQSDEERIAMGILLTFFTGVVMILGGVIHQGGVVSFFSRTSMQGYVTGTSFLIVLSQIPPWLGIRLPSPKLNIFTAIDIVTLIINSMMISIVFFMASVATGSKLAAKGGYEISPNQELLGIGFANLGASMFQGMPSSAGMARSAVNAQSAHTPLASMFTAGLVILTILFLTKPLYYLPQAPLAAIILLSASGLPDFAEPKWLRKVRPHEFYVWVTAFVGTLCFGLISGLFVSLFASLIEIMVRTKKPPVFLLGQSANGEFVKLEAHEHEHENVQDQDSGQHPAVQPLPDVLVVRMEQNLYFANTSHLIHAIERNLKAAAAHGRMLGAVIDGSRMNDIDATAIHLLMEYCAKLCARDQTLLFANVRSETETSLLASGLLTAQEHDHTNCSEHHRPSSSIAAAVAYLRQSHSY